MPEILPIRQSGSATIPGARPRIITASPALALVDAWRAELAVLQRRAGQSDATKTLAGCIDELVAAIKAGRNIESEITLKRAHKLSSVPLSTLRWACKNKPTEIGARKERGTWYLDVEQFDRWRQVPAPVAREAA
jgi:hypothetical protein